MSGWHRGRNASSLRGRKAGVSCDLWRGLMVCKAQFHVDELDVDSWSFWSGSGSPGQHFDELS
jgi:hypothetical protein